MKENNIRQRILDFIAAIRGSSPMAVRSFLLPDYKYDQEQLLKWRYYVASLLDLEEVSADDQSMTFVGLKPTNKHKGIVRYIRITAESVGDTIYIGSVEKVARPDNRPFEAWTAPDGLPEDKSILIKSLDAIVHEVCNAHHHDYSYVEHTTLDELDLLVMQPIGLPMLHSLNAVRIETSTIYLKYFTADPTHEFVVTFKSEDNQWKVATMNTLDGTTDSLIDYLTDPD